MNTNQERKILTADQQALVNEFIAAYGLEESQISFEGSNLNPIFDYEALCLLRIKLTSFRDVIVSEPTHNSDENSTSVSCTITLEDGRTVTVAEKVHRGDLMPDGSNIETQRQMETFARARAMRFAIRTAGVNLVRAHREYITHGTIAAGKPIDPRHAQYQELHVLAAKVGHIKGGDKTEYRNYIAGMYDGRTTSKELSDIELRRLIYAYRGLARLKDSIEQANSAGLEKAAA